MAYKKTKTGYFLTDAKGENSVHYERILSHKELTPSDGFIVFTVYDKRTKSHATFKVAKEKNKKKNGSKFPYNWNLYLLTGPNNMEDFTRVGFITPTRQDVYITNRAVTLKGDSSGVKVKFTYQSPKISALIWFVQRMKDGKPFPKGTGIVKETRCSTCGRRLTDDESVMRGIGPVCLEKSKAL